MDNESNSTGAECDRLFANNLQALKNRSLPYDELLELAAQAITAQSMTEEINEELLTILRDYSEAEKKLVRALDGYSSEWKFNVIEFMETSHVCVAKALLTGVKMQKTAFARKNAKKKADNCKKKPEKEFVFDCWKDWRTGKTIYKGKAAFANDMLTKCEHLKSSKVIEDWCRVWEKSEPC